MEYESVLEIADEFNFYPTYELSKVEFDKALAKFLIDGGYEQEVISRYEDHFKGMEDQKSQRIALFRYQVTHKKLMVEGLAENICFLNASETGTGKTYKTLSLAESDRRPLFVICPKSMLLEWYILALQHRVEILAICNYETLIRGKMYEYRADANLENMPRVDCPYLKKVETKKAKGKKEKSTSFVWQNLPARTLIVFDEAHYCKNVGTQRTSILTGAYDYAHHPENRWRAVRILLLSATIIEKKDNLRPFMYVLGYAKNPKDKTIVDSVDFSVRSFGKKLKTERRMTRATMREARAALNDDHHSDTRTKMFRLDEEARNKIEKLCKEIRDILLASKEKKPKNHLAQRIALRQQIEALKLGILFEELKKRRAEGYSVVIFVNFKQSLAALQTLITEQMAHEKFAVIIGGQSAAERLKQIESFQNGECDVMLSMIGAGGVGISLHDTKGGRPRYSLISPPESATQTIQILGRLDRIGAKTNSVQRIIFVSDTIEDKIASSLEKKMQTIGDLNDADGDADNLFLYEVYHEYEPKDSTIDDQDDNDTISMKVDKETRKVIVNVPDYMVEAFENGIPPQTTLTMRIHGSEYHFDIGHFHTIREYLAKLNV